jgi:hypothetical protein
MDKLKRPVFKVPEISETPVPSTSTITKWIPFICAGAAAGISIVALQEIKKLRVEVQEIKKEPTNSSEMLGKRMETMEQQLKTLTDFIKNRNEIETVSQTIKKTTIPSPPPQPPVSGVMKNIVQQPPLPEGIQIINGEEYEEIEVTDDEED